MSRVFDAMRRANPAESEPPEPVYELLDAFPSERVTETLSEGGHVARGGGAWVAGARTQPPAPTADDSSADPELRDQQKVLGPLVPVSDEISFRELIDAIARDEQELG